MPIGDSLGTSFNQDDAEKQRSTHAKMDDQAAAFKRKTTIDADRIQHARVGNEVAYTKGQGTIVSKKGAYVTIYNQDANAYDQVHAGETYIPGDTISMGVMNQLWDQMATEVRHSLLSKALIAQPEYYINKTWNELPTNLREVLKLSPSYTSVGSKVKNPPKGAHQDASTEKKPKVKQPGSKDPFGGDAHTATSGHSRSSKPGNKVTTTIGGKKVQVTERQRQTWESNTKPEHRNDPGFKTDYGNKLTGKKPKDSTFKPAAKPDAKKPTDGKRYSTTTFVGGKPIELSPEKTKPKDPKPEKRTTGITSTTSAGHTAASEAAARPSAAAARPSAPKPEAVKPASGKSPSSVSYGSQYKGPKDGPSAAAKPAASTPAASTPASGKSPSSVSYGSQYKGPKDGPSAAAKPAGPKSPSSTSYGSQYKGPKEGVSKTIDDLSKAIINARFAMLMERIKAEYGVNTRQQSERDTNVEAHLRDHSPEEASDTSPTSWSRAPGGKGNHPFKDRLLPKKSDLEHSHLGGVVTDTPFDASDDYEEEERHQLANEFQHEKEKKPKDMKEYEILSGKTDEEVSKEGGGAVTSGTAGVSNATYSDKEREIKNKYNSRSGPRQVTKEEAERFLNK